MQQKPVWRAYPSIEHPRDVIIQDCEAIAGSMQWCLTEKIHGANCSVIVPQSDSEDLIIASRNQMLSSTQDFHNLRECLSADLGDGDKLAGDLRMCAKYLFTQKHVPDGAVVFYGEVFGGVFPKVPKVPGATVVQHGIYYTPGNNVRFFDIRGSDGRFVSYDIAVEAMKRFHIPFVPITAKGAFRELLQLAESTCCDVSTICTLYGLPIIESNEREGNVLKPLGHVRLRTGERCIIKVKNPRFNELIEAGVAAYRKHQTKKALQPSTQTSPIIKKTITDPKQHLLGMLNEPRIVSVCSKMHPDDVTTENIRTIVAYMTEDILKDFAKDLDIKTIPEADITAMKKELERRSYTVAQTYVERLEEEMYGNEDE